MSKVEDLIVALNEQMDIIAKDKDAAIAGKKASGLRVRKATLELAKIGKELRSETIANEKA